MSEVPTQEQAVASPSDVVTRIIARVWVPLLVVLGVAAIALISTMVVNGRRQSLVESSTILIEEVEASFSLWLEASQDGREQLDDGIVTQLELLVARHGNRYAGRRALQMLALRHVERTEWREAADKYRRLSDFSEGYLSAVALGNAAAAFEELGDYAQAMTLYRDIVNLYPDGMAGPRALFSIGRLREQQGEAVAAGDAYAELESLYASSQWSLLARNRLIYLRASGALDDS